MINYYKVTNYEFNVQTNEKIHSVYKGQSQAITCKSNNGELPKKAGIAQRNKLP